MMAQEEEEQQQQRQQSHQGTKGLARGGGAAKAAGCGSAEDLLAQGAARDTSLERDAGRGGRAGSGGSRSSSSLHHWLKAATASTTTAAADGVVSASSLAPSGAPHNPTNVSVLLPSELCVPSGGAERGGAAWWLQQLLDSCDAALELLDGPGEGYDT